MDSYTWTEYDPREGGVQLIKDSSNNVQITTEFLKVQGGEHGGSWAVRVKGEPIDKGKQYDSYTYPGALHFQQRRYPMYRQYFILV